MPSSSSSSGSPITISADVRVGDNSGAGGAYEYSLGIPGAGDAIIGQKTWDADLSDGFDSNWVEVQLVATGGANPSPVSWSVTGGSAGLNYNGAKFNYISGVHVSASVGGQNCRMSWNSLTVQFYRAGTLTQTVTIDGPVADTINSGVSNASNDITPSNSDNDKVVVSAMVRLESTAHVLPSPGAISGVLSVSAM